MSGPGLSQIEFGTAEAPRSCASAARRSAVVASPRHPEHPGGAGGEARAPAAVPTRVRRLHVDEVRHGVQGVVDDSGFARDGTEEDRIWAVFDRDEAGWQSFVSDPDVPAIMRDAGHKGTPQSAAFAARCDS